jgi:Domain of unknown function (DUF4390)
MRLGWTLAVAIGLVAAVEAAESLRVTPIVHDDKVVVSFELADAYTDAIRQAIGSGLRTTFTYELELRTVGTAWLDRTIATVVVTTSDLYDNLMRRHTLSRTVDGRVEEVLVTEDESEVKTWLTRWSRVPLYQTSKLDPTRDYYVRVSARMRPLSGSLLGWAKATVGQAKFTVIP